MQKAIYTLYEFNDLKPEIQEKLIEQEQKFSWEIADNMLTDMLEDETLIFLERDGWKVLNDSLEVYYSLGYCQGDGFQFNGEFEKDGVILTIKHSGHYNYSYCTNISITDADGEDVEREDLIQEYHQLCKELEKVGYSMLEDLTSEENARENLEQADQLYFENGTIAPKTN